MSEKQITKQVLALPLRERVRLAEALWQSINESSASSAAQEESAALEEATRRDAELTSGKAVGRSHREVMKSARRAIE
ncbi:MAG: addiction module protein [Planctomycetota bacterium]|nr:addiction module protein [Planctomycetota bacterium]